MTETIEQMAQRLLDSRGYIVVDGLEEHPIGHVFPKMARGICGPLQHPLVIVAPTDAEDMKGQHKFLNHRLPSPSYLLNRYFYRCIAE